MHKQEYHNMGNSKKRHIQESHTNPMSNSKKPRPGGEYVQADSNDAYPGAGNFQIKNRGGNLPEYQKTMKPYDSDFLVSSDDAAIGQKEGKFLGGSSGTAGDGANLKTGKKGKWTHKQMMAGQNFDLGKY